MNNSHAFRVLAFRSSRPSLIDKGECDTRRMGNRTPKLCAETFFPEAFKRLAIEEIVADRYRERQVCPLCTVAVPWFPRFGQTYMADDPLTAVSPGLGRRESSTITSVFKPPTTIVGFIAAALQVPIRPFFGSSL